MSTCHITNYTSHHLNASLTHVCAIDFRNDIAPGQTVKIEPRRVWLKFTLEVILDENVNRYDSRYSQASIAMLSLACIGTTAALAVLALTAATSVGVGSTIVAGTDAVGLAVSSVTSGIASMAAAVVGGLETAYLAAQSLCTMHSSNATNLYTTFAPAIIAMVEKEVGGLSAVQKELLAILSSPSIESDVRNSALSILARLNEAAAVDAAGGELKTIESAPEPLSPPAPSIETPSFPLSRRPSKRVPSSVSTLLNRIIPEANQERKTANIAAKQSKLAAKKAAKEEELARKDAASWEDVTIEDDVASGKILAVNSAAEHKRVVVYGLVMNEQRHFEVREEEGRLLLVDGHTKSVISKVS